MKKYHYVYKITNTNPTDERKYYIGVRSSTVPPEEDINYNSSSKSLKQALIEIGHKHFAKEILSIFETRKLAMNEEIRLHNLHDVTRNPNFYNKAKQTSVRFDTTGISFYQTRQTREKAVNTRRENNDKWFSDETKIKIGNANRGEKNGMKKGHTDDTKRRMSLNNAMNSEENRIKVSNALMGHVVSMETRKKIGVANMGFKHSEESKELMSRQNIGTNNPNSKKFIFTSPNGEEYFVEGNLENFCKSFGLNKDRMSSIARGKAPLVSQKRSKMYGWCCALA